MTNDTLTVAEWRAEQAAAMKERDLQEHVRKLAKSLNALYFHAWNSKHSPSGFPDVVIVTRDARLLFAELKRQDKESTIAQEAWLDGLSEVAVEAGSGRFPKSPIEVYTWRPMDWLDGTIEAVLRGETT